MEEDFDQFPPIEGNPHQGVAVIVFALLLVLLFGLGLAYIGPHS